jgi:hypothetical protein
MSHPHHVLLWINHREAKVFQFNATDVDRTTILSELPDDEFFRRVVLALATAGAILITGPAKAKTQLVAYIKREQPTLAERISGVQTLDPPSEGALVAFARTFFEADDRLRAQSGQLRESQSARDRWKPVSGAKE